ncbi:hypothetical protein BM1_02518 [Bipolaris maydis]|nr:hypothetical protein BM1_02518 [Bipolaris maydis]
MVRWYDGKDWYLDAAKILCSKRIANLTNLVQGIYRYTCVLNESPGMPTLRNTTWQRSQGGYWKNQVK